jgi:transcriptional regulator with XRE-family HTH domain
MEKNERTYLKKLKEQREKLNIKQVYIADQLKITSASYSRQERGVSAMEVGTLITICEILDIKPEVLFTQDVIKTEESMTAILQIKLPSRIKDEIIRLLQKNDCGDLEVLNQIK